MNIDWEFISNCVVLLILIIVWSIQSVGDPFMIWGANCYVLWTLRRGQK